MADYPQYPQYPPAAPARPGPPRSIVNAVRLMYTGAALAVINGIVGIATLPALKRMIEQRRPALSPSSVNALSGFLVAMLIAGAVIGGGLWFWMAWANKRGHSWARILSTVFFGIYTINVMTGFAQASIAANRTIGVVEWVVGLAAVVFLWQRQSSNYYAAIKQSAGYAPVPYERSRANQHGPPST